MVDVKKITKTLFLLLFLAIPMASATIEQLKQMAPASPPSARLPELLAQDNALFSQYEKEPDNQRILEKAIPSCLQVLYVLYRVPDSPGASGEEDGTVSVSSFVVVTENNLYRLVRSFFKGGDAAADQAFAEVIDAVKPGGG